MCKPNWAIHSRGKDGTQIDFMCFNMIDPASSWFKVVELLVTTDMVILEDTKGQRGDS